MNNTYQNFRSFLVIIIILLVVIFSLSSCSILKEKTSKESVLISNTNVKKDSISKVEINKAIDEKAEYKVQKSDTGDEELDEKVNLQVDKILSAINFEKKSGDNYTKMYYDLENKIMKMESKIGETQNSDVSTNNDSVSEKSLTESLIEETIKSKKPWWVYALVLYFFWPITKPIILILFGSTNLSIYITDFIKKLKT